MKRVLIVLIAPVLLVSLALCRNVSAAPDPYYEFKAKFSSIAPVIDGRLGSAEWNDTTRRTPMLFNASGGPGFISDLYLKHNGTHIHLGLMIWHSVTHFIDEVIIAFDEGDDGGRGGGSRDETLTPLQEDAKTVDSNHELSDGYYNTSWYVKSTEIDFDADLVYEDDHLTDPSEIEYWEGNMWIDGHWECEFSIPFVGNDAGTSDVSDLSCNVTDTVGIKIQYYYPSQNYYCPWGDKFCIEDYADLSFPAPLIESCNSSGTEKNNFYLYEDVRANGSGFLPNATCDFYVVNDVEVWTDGMLFPARVSGTATSISSGADGSVLPVIVWSDPPTEGSYDMIVDVNMNGFYDEGIDALDSNDVEVTAGFVIPEFPALSILLLSQLLVFAATIFANRHNH